MRRARPLVFAFLVAACSGESKGPQGGRDKGGEGARYEGDAGSRGSWSSACGERVTQPPGPSRAPACPSVDEMTAWMVGPPECPDVVIPSERELECNAAKLPRRELGRGLVGVELDLGELETRPDAAAHYGMAGDTRWILGLSDALTDFPRELAMPAVTGLPPHFEFRGPNRTVDWASERETFEAPVRAYGAELLRQRALGRIGLFNYGLGPHEPQPPEDPQQLEQALEQIIAPRTAVVARIAELVQAELLMPFGGEADILANSGAFRSLPPKERVALVQKYVDVVRNTAKQYFSGILVGASAWQYYPENDGFWSSAPLEEVSWKGFDWVSFTMLPVTFNRCTPELAKAFMATQLAKISSLAARDGFEWTTVELDILTFGALRDYTPERGCSMPRENFLPIWDETLSALLQAPTRPRAVILAPGPAEWADDRALADELSQRFTSFATALKQ